MNNPPNSPPGIQMHSLKRGRPTTPVKSVIAAASSQEKNAAAAASSHAVPSATTPLGDAPVEPSVKYRGVYVKKDKISHPFAAMLPLTEHDKLHLGYFATPEEAARAVDSAARKYLVNPCCNFLEDGTLNPNRNFRATRLLTRAGMEKAKFIQGRKAARLMEAQKAGSSADMVTNEAVGEASVSSEGGHDDNEAEGEGPAGMEVEEEQASTRGDRMQGSEDEEETDDEEAMAVVNEEAAKRVSQSLQQPEQPPQQPLPPPQQQPQQQDRSQHPFSAVATSATATTSSGSAVGRAAAVDVWVELKTAVFRKLMSVDGPALSEDEASKYEKLLHLLHEPTASLRGFVDDVVLRSGFSAEVADRAAGLLANMAATGGFDQ